MIGYTIGCKTRTRQHSARTHKNRNASESFCYSALGSQRWRTPLIAPLLATCPRRHGSIVFAAEGLCLALPSTAESSFKRSEWKSCAVKNFSATLALLLILGSFSSLGAQDKKLITVNLGYAAISGSFAPLWVGFD